eukprot:5680236-Pyramimonas_sp.AAC.1
MTQLASDGSQGGPDDLGEDEIPPRPSELPPHIGDSQLPLSEAPPPPPDPAGDQGSLCYECGHLAKTLRLVRIHRSKN